MTCGPFLAVDVASTLSPRSASAPATETPAGEQSGPAATTETQRTTGTDGPIEKRAARLRHANAIQKARFVRILQTLSKREGRA